MTAAGDSLTVVQDARGRPLTKGFHLRDGRIVKRSFPNVAEVTAIEMPVNDITSLAAALDDVTASGIAGVIRGTPGKFYPRHGGPAFRLLYPQEGQAAARTGARISPELIRRNKLEPDGVHRYAVTWLPTFEDCPRHWVILDIDRVPVPAHLVDDWVDDPDTAVEHVLMLLPEPFHAATCWWSISSSAAIPGPQGREVASKFKVKLAFWLDRPLVGGELKRWMAAEKAPVDPAVFGTVQLTYVARPVFGQGLHDPVPQRTGIWRGEADTVPVPEPLPRPAVDDHRPKAPAFRPVVGLDELQGALHARLADESHVREHLLRATRAYVRQHGPSIDQAVLVAALEGVAHDYRSEAEVAAYGLDRMVGYVVDQEAACAGRWSRQAASNGVLPPYFGREAENRFREVNRQRAFLRGWLHQNWTFAIARREIADRRAAAFAAAGLD